MKDKSIIDITLGKAYYNDGFINIRTFWDDMFAGQDAVISVQLGTNSKDIISDAWINRKVNDNNTPRIMMGIKYTNWVQKNYKQGDVMLVEIVSPTSIILHDK